jgi:hypothetical protein
MDDPYSSLPSQTYSRVPSLVPEADTLLQLGRQDYDYRLPEGDIPWFEIVPYNGTARMMVHEGPDQAWYQFVRRDPAWFQQWARIVQDARDHLFINNRSTEPNHLFDMLFEHQLPRIVQAAGVTPRGKGIRQPKPDNRLLLKQGETSESHEVEIKLRRQAVMESRKSTRWRAYDRLNALPGKIEGWKATVERHPDQVEAYANRFISEVRGIYELYRRGFLRWRDYTGSCRHLLFTHGQGPNIHFNIGRKAA